MALSRVADPDDPDAVLVTADREGTPCGLLQLVPWGHPKLSAPRTPRGSTMYPPGDRSGSSGRDS